MHVCSKSFELLCCRRQLTLEAPWSLEVEKKGSNMSFEQTKYLLRILRCSLFGQRGNLTTKPNKWQYCVSGPLCCFVLHNLQANQIGLERSVSWLLLWDRKTGDMGMSNFIFPLKEEGGFEERRKNTCGLDRWTDRNQRLYKRSSPT